MTASKAKLLEAIAGKNRGLLATDADQRTILGAIALLETENPTPRPLEEPAKLSGNWRLLYTTSTDLLRIEQIPFFKLGQIYQVVRTASAQIFNLAEVQGVPLLEGMVSVSATFEPVSETRVNVRFDRGIVGLQRLLGYQDPSSFLSMIDAGKRFPPIDFAINGDRQRGWLEITYLDDDLRIGRGNEGSVFVLTKTP